MFLHDNITFTDVGVITLLNELSIPNHMTACILSEETNTA